VKYKFPQAPVTTPIARMGSMHIINSLEVKKACEIGCGIGGGRIGGQRKVSSLLSHSRARRHSIHATGLRRRTGAPHYRWEAESLSTSPSTPSGRAGATSVNISKGLMVP